MLQLLTTRCPYLYPDEYLRESTKKVLLQHELKGRVEVAVLSFVDLVLDDKAPPMVLPCFMHALFLANNDPTRRPNKGKIKVACTRSEPMWPSGKALGW